MKKTLLTVIAVAAMAGVASANTYVNWKADGGFTLGGNPILPAVGQQTLAQLLFLGPNGVIDPVDPFNAAGGFAGGDDVVLDTFNPQNSGDDGVDFTDYALFDAGIYNGANVGNNIAGRIFQDLTPEPGEMYWDGPAAPQADIDPGGTPTPPPQIVQLNTDFVNGNELDKEIVPEPATALMCGLGALALFVRRLRRK